MGPQSVSGGEDLLFVKDKNDQVLASNEYNGPPHRPTKVTDAGGKATLLGYNAAGQVTSVQLPTGETTAFQYDSQGFMEAIIPPAPGSRVDFTKDNVGRIATSSDAVNGTLAYSYDKLDRLRKVTYPDNTTEETAYDRLDVDYVVDRNNLKTDYTFNAVRQLTDVIDPKNQRTQLTWCDCGALSTLIDPKNQLTEWRYDVAGRLTAKIYPDTTRVTYEYEARKSRLKRVTDAMQQQTNYVYDKADALTRTYYTQAKHATPAVDFEYDPLYGRLTKMTDGTGVTHFGYLPIPAGHGGGKGAGRLGSVDGPLVDDTITYGYDDSGRVLSTAVNGVAETLVLDANGRVQNVINPLGTFTYAYDPANGLLNEVTRPGGKTAFDYYPSADLQNRGRLQAIRHLNNAQQVLDRFAYGYDPGGRITGWEQQRGSDPAKRWTLGYDLASQLETAVLAPVGGGAAITNQAWHYDLAGNRDQQTVDGHITDYSLPNQLNQLAKVSPKGPTHFEGQLNQAAQVQVDGQPATVDSQNRFSSAVTLQSSLQDVSVAASTAGGQVLTQVYQVVRDQELSYDLNGNMTSDGTQQYGWDAANRLLSVADAQKHTLSEFTYDGLWRRVRMVEKQGLTTAADRKFIWAGARPIEERNQSNNVEKRFYGSGVQVVQGPLSGAYLYSRDHLGSIRSVLDGTGNQVAAYDYDLWGNRTQTAGTFAADFGYAGYFEHAPSGLKLTWFRGYSPLLGRWISRDPLGEFGGTNLYGYVDNASVSDIDMFGLLKKEVVPTYLIENTQELIDRITGSSLSKPEMERATNAIISAMTPMDLISGKATSLGGIDPSSKEITLTPQQLAYIEELLRRIGKSDSELSKRLKDELKKAIKKGSIRVACPPATPTPGPAQPYRGW
jgi:RHS repeat-associated protein